ncbi:MAG: TIGR04255 family protein [Gammaproteobacteria bacterium]|nr:TIGR04255 family protein [Gammaproteobacteria bacterium]
MADALGQLPNAPLIYVLAQIRFTHVPRMDRRWEDLHERVIERYPRAEPERIEQLTLKDGKPVVGDSIQRWNLLSDDRLTGLIVAADSLVLHSARYETSKHFVAELNNVLQDFVKILPEKGIRITRQGLRYVDLLLPENDLSVDDQIIETLRLPRPPSLGEPERMEQIVTYMTGVGGKLVIRHRQSIKTDLLPGDLFPNNLGVAPRLSRPKPENQIAGLLDYDHFIEKEIPIDVDTIVDSFRNLHSVTSAAFRETTTGKAQAIWKTEAI